MAKKDYNAERDYNTRRILEELRKDEPISADQVRLGSLDERFLKGIDGILPKG